MDCTGIKNPYEKAATTENIVKEIKEFLKSGTLNITKPFYDLNWRDI